MDERFGIYSVFSVLNSKKKIFNLGWMKNCVRFGLSYFVYDINSKLYEELELIIIYFFKFLISVREIWSKIVMVLVVNCLIELMGLIFYSVFV